MKIKTTVVNCVNIFILIMAILLFCKMISSFALYVPLMDDYSSCLDFMN